MPQPGHLGLTFDIQGNEELLRVMSTMLDRVHDLKPAWQKIRLDFYRREKALFDAEGAVEGYARWAPISEEWAEYKAKKGWSSRILVQKTNMMRSLISNTDESVLRMDPMEMEIGTGTRYAHYHHPKPGQESKRGLARRPMIRVTKSQRTYWKSVITKFLYSSGQADRPTKG